MYEVCSLRNTIDKYVHVEEGMRVLLERKNTSQITLMKGETCIESRGKLRKLLFYERGKLSIALMKKFRD